MLRRVLYAWIVNVAAIWIASLLIDGVDYSDDFWILIVAGLVFSLVNLLVKPVVKLLALPLVIVTLGIALFFVNLLMLYITAWLVPGFELQSFMAAIWATLAVTLVNWVLQGVFGLGQALRRGPSGRCSPGTARTSVTCPGRESPTRTRSSSGR